VLETDPPFQSKTRAVINTVLSASALKVLRERFVAEAYPLTVFPDAIGMAPDHRRYLLPYGNVVFNSFGPRNALFADSVRDAAEVVGPGAKPARKSVRHRFWRRDSFCGPPR